MFSLPLLLQEDMAAIEAALADFIPICGAQFALFMDPGGFIIARQGDAEGIDLATLGALAANSFAATQAIAAIIKDGSVTSLYQEGEQHSLLLFSIQGSGFLAVVFPSAAGVGSVKYCARQAVDRISLQMRRAHTRAPAVSLDLASLNLPDAAPLFHRRPPDAPLPG